MLLDWTIHRETSVRSPGGYTMPHEHRYLDSMTCSICQTDTSSITDQQRVMQLLAACQWDGVLHENVESSAKTNTRGFPKHKMRSFCICGTRLGLRHYFGAPQPQERVPLMAMHWRRKYRSPKARYEGGLVCSRQWAWQEGHNARLVQILIYVHANLSDIFCEI